MRKGLMIAAAVTLLAPLPAAAQDWYRLTRTDEFTDYVDKDSIRQDGDWTVVTLLTISAAPGPGDPASTSADIQIDCRAQTLMLASFSAFGPDKALLGTAEWPEQRKVHPIEKRSAFGNLAAYACSPDRPGGTKVSEPYADMP